MHAIAHPPAGLFGVAFLQAMRRALPQLLIAAIAAGLATYLAQSWVTPRYVGEARLVVSSPDPDPAVPTHIRALGDPVRLFSVATELNLQSRPELFERHWGQMLLQPLGLGQIWGAHQLENADERLLAAIYGRFAAVAGDRSGEIAVRFAASDPEIAARFVNRTVELYLASLSPAGKGGGGTGKVEVTRWAEQPVQPLAPRRGAMAMLGMAVVLLLGVGALAVREALFRTAANCPFGEAGDVERSRADRSASIAASGKLSTAAEVADRLLALPATDRGCRIMIAGEDKDIDAVAEAGALADVLSSSGRKAVLLRWGLGGGDVTDQQPRQGVLGINDLLEGRATFEEIVMRLPGSRAHAIAAGSPAKNRKAVLDPDLVGLVLDTLDEVYDYILVEADHGDAIELFAALEGRFDACVSVGEEGRPAGRFTAGFDRFLGFEVIDIHIVRLERKRQVEHASSDSPGFRVRWA